MLTHRAYRYRLYPTAEQETALRQAIGAARCVFNLALEQRTVWWRPDRRITWAQQSRELTALRAETDWLKAVSRGVLDSALSDLDGAEELEMERKDG